jgi:hypothetical protein
MITPTTQESSFEGGVGRAFEEVVEIVELEKEDDGERLVETVGGIDELVVLLADAIESAIVIPVVVVGRDVNVVRRVVVVAGSQFTAFFG